MLLASRSYLARSVFELHVKGDAAYECNRAANSRPCGVPISGNRYALLARANQGRQLRTSEGYSHPRLSTGKKNCELLGSKTRRRLPRSKGRLVDGMAQGRARSRNLLRLVSHGGALRALAACSSSRACRRSSLRQRTQTPEQCHKAGTPLEGSRPVLH